ncbi:hypothetical protein OAS07_05985 [Candidatus Thioglobus sp.]|nr:hypothetical protein [Candidatus Thioglobus sp.]MDC0965913.1 hypothetical protein [Candidatus Thioglobus sp.]MDC1166011.1 hypothetical protein [Candidatus Thioglobus sp.]MDC3266117.1 hypothetical protein [Candidatus Thioglobus sp.]
MGSSEALKQLQSQYLINDVDFACERIKLEYIDMIKRADPDYFVTLTLAYNVNECDAIKALKTCIWHVNKQVYGRSVKDKANRLTMLPFIETSASNELHFHLLVKQPHTHQGVNLRKIFRQKWQALDVHGYATFDNDEWFKKVNNIDGIAKYITKQTYGDNRPLVVECLNY